MPSTTLYCNTTLSERTDSVSERIPVILTSPWFLFVGDQKLKVEECLLYWCSILSFTYVTFCMPGLCFVGDSDISDTGWFSSSLFKCTVPLRWLWHLFLVIYLLKLYFAIFEYLFRIPNGPRHGWKSFWNLEILPSKKQGILATECRIKLLLYGIM